MLLSAAEWHYAKQVNSRPFQLGSTQRWSAGGASFGQQTQPSEERSYRHWRIYFDDAGCVDVIAQSFQLA